MTDEWQTTGFLHIQYEVLCLIAKLINLSISILFFLSLILFIYHFFRIVCLARASSGLLFSVLTYQQC